MLIQLLALGLTAVSSSMTDCSKGLSLFKVDALGFWPDPAVKGENSSVSFAFNVPDREGGFTGGTSKTSITYNFIPVSQTTQDLCIDTACPIIPGPHNQTASSIFPSDSPSGSITIKFEWFDQSNALLLCAVVKSKIT